MGTITRDARPRTTRVEGFGLKYALVFGLLSVICAFYCVTLQPIFLRLLLGSLALCWFGVALAYAKLGARTFGKQRDGRLSLWSAVFWPYHLLNAFLLSLFRKSAKENPFDAIDDSILLACKLSSEDESGLQKRDVRAVLDLTCEFSETPFLRTLNYRSIPVLDTHSPTLEQLREGARFLADRAKDGAVYVHCALGHGRSALFVAAYLIETGRARSAEEATEIVRQKRANIELAPAQLSRLEEFAQEKGSSNSKDG